MQEEVDVDIDLLNTFLGDKKRMYQMCLKKGIIPPEFGSSAVNGQYLYGLWSGQYFHLTRQNFQKGVLFPGRNVSRIDLYQILEEKTDKPLGFDMGCLPDYQWLLDAVATVTKHEHSIFKEISDDIPKIERKFPKGFFDDFTLSDLKNLKKNTGLLKKTKQEKESIQKTKTENLKKKHEKRKQLLQDELEKVEKRLQKQMNRLHNEIDNQNQNGDNPNRMQQEDQNDN